MPLTITGLQPTGPITIQLTGGGSVRIAPGETTPPLPDADVEGNPAVEKLTGRGLIDVRPAPRATGTGRTGSKGD
jgi:hypothetical protein